MSAECSTHHSWPSSDSATILIVVPADKTKFPETDRMAATSLAEQDTGSDASGPLVDDGISFMTRFSFGVLPFQI